MRFLKGHKTFDGERFLTDDPVLVINDQNLLTDIIQEGRVESSNIERFDGTLVPGFINAHCHLELSHLKGIIPKHTGVPGFAREIVTRRGIHSREQREDAMKSADKDMWDNGIVAVGDISNDGSSFDVKARSSIHYHTFVELIGLRPSVSDAVFEKGIELMHQLNSCGLKGSFAAHAPYSASKELMSRIIEYNSSRRLPFSIHNQESSHESDFFYGRPSGFHDLYAFLNLDLAWFKAPRHSSLEDYAGLLPGTPSLLVHNTFTTARDIEKTKVANVYWCFCPGANQYIEGRLPDFSLFLRAPENLCFGTDSLASNDQLDLIQEANSFMQAAPDVTHEQVLKALTSGAARALAIDDAFGHLKIGRKATLNSLTSESGKLKFIKKII